MSLPELRKQRKERILQLLRTTNWSTHKIAKMVADEFGECSHTFVNNLNNQYKIRKKRNP